MGYFSNGTEWECYEAQYCSRCVHHKTEPGEGCAVVLLHMTRNYKDCNDEDSPLHVLIPRDGIRNGRCAMFHEGKPSDETHGLTEADLKYLQWHQENRPFAAKET